MSNQKYEKVGTVRHDVYKQKKKGFGEKLGEFIGGIIALIIIIAILGAIFG